MAELSPLAAQIQHWRAARAETVAPGPEDTERLERIRRLAFAAVLQEPQVLDAVGTPSAPAARW